MQDELDCLASANPKLNYQKMDQYALIVEIKSEAIHGLEFFETLRINFQDEDDCSCLQFILPTQ